MSAQELTAAHLGLGLGWGFPAGQVSSVTDVLILSPSLAATDVYYRTLTFHIALGAHEYPWLFELAIEGGFARLTPEVHAAIDSVRPDGRRASVEDFTFELFGGRMLRVPFAVESLSLFAGGGVGVANLTLVSNNGYEPAYDTGFGVSGKAGLHWYLDDYVTLRIVGRYQVLSAWVDLPRTVTVSAMLLAWGVG